MSHFKFNPSDEKSRDKVQSEYPLSTYTMDHFLVSAFSWHPYRGRMDPSHAYAEEVKRSKSSEIRMFTQN
jgi:hypothetical protein